MVLNSQPELDVQQAVEMFRFCKEFRTMPRAGGLLDQDAKDIWILELVSNAHNEREELDRKREEAKMKRR